MIDVMLPNDVEVFRSVLNDYDGAFALPITYLGLGTDREAIRWIQREVNTDLSKPGRIKKLKWGTVSKSSEIYEFDTGKTFIVTINSDVWALMNEQEKRAFAFYLLAHINVTVGDDSVKFSLNSPYVAERMVDDFVGRNVLPKPEILEARIQGSNRAEVG